jgi:hypothetical protein
VIPGVRMGSIVVEKLNETTFVFTYNPVVVVSLRLRESVVRSYDKLVAWLRATRNIPITRTRLLARIIEYCIQHPELILTILEETQ